MDTENKFMVGVQGDFIRVLKPVPPMLTKAQALNLAAYLVALANDDGSFDAVLVAVLNT